MIMNQLETREKMDNITQLKGGVVMGKLFFVIALCLGITALASAYDVVNIDLNGSTSDPNYNSDGPFSNNHSGAVVLNEWDGYYQGDGVIMSSPRCINIGVPGKTATYGRAVQIVDPCTHSYVSGEAGMGDLLGDGFKSDYIGVDPNLFPKLYVYGNWAYGGIFDVYITAAGTAAGGQVWMRDGRGTEFGPSTLTGVNNENNWVAGDNFVKFTDVWIGGNATRDANGPNDVYLDNDVYLSDPNCLVIGYNNQIDGIQLASVKRKVRMSGYYLPTPANDPCVVAIASPGALRRAVKGQWPVETPLAVIKLTGTSNRTNLLCGDYDAYYETNLRGGEYDKDGPDAMWATSGEPLIEYVDQDWVADGYMSYVDSAEWMEYDLIATTDTKAFYKVRAIVNCWWGAANIGVYVDKSEELGELEQEKYEDMGTAETDANALYWTNDVTIMLLTGFHKLRLRQNGAYYNILGFQIAYESTLVVNFCSDVLKYGLGIPGDINRDCYVDLEDLKVIVDDWANCNDPQDPSCIVEEPED